MPWEPLLPEPLLMKKFGNLGLGYDMPCEPCDGMDPVAVSKTMDKAISLS